MNRTWLFIFGFIAFRIPYGMTGSIIRLYLFLLIILFFLTSISALSLFSKTNQQSKFVYFLMVSIAVYPFIVRIINGYGFNSFVFRDFLLQITLINLFMFSIRDQFWEKLKTIDNVLILYILINFVSIILYPDGLFKFTNQGIREDVMWFLGGKNYMIRYIIPAIIVKFIVSYHYKGYFDLKSILLYVVSLYSIILTESSTSIVVILMMGIGLFGVPLIRKWNLFNPLIVFVTYLVLSIALIFLGFQEHFSSYIESLFDKDATMSGRTAIWEYTIFRLLSSPYIGFGYHIGEEWQDVLGFLYSNMMGVSHPHNYMLFVLLQGGGIMLALLIILFCSFSVFTKPIRNSTEVCLLTLMCGGFFIDGITESLTNAPLMFPMLALFSLINDNFPMRKYKKRANEVTKR